MAAQPPLTGRSVQRPEATLWCVFCAHFLFTKKYWKEHYAEGANAAVAASNVAMTLSAIAARTASRPETSFCEPVIFGQL
jgi:hypothetical protein